MKKLFAHISIIFLLVVSSCVSQNATPFVRPQPQKVVLESIDFSRIDKAVKKYERLQSQAKWIKCVKYLAIGVGCIGAGFLIFNSCSKTQETPKCPETGAAAKDENSDAAVDSAMKKLELKKLTLLMNRMLKEGQAKASFTNDIKKGSRKALNFVAYTTIVASLWAIINKSKDALGNQFGLSEVYLDSNFYKHKSANLNGLIKQMGIFLMQHENKASKGEATSKFFDLIFADILINHTTLIRWIEDLIGFIKCMVISNTGENSLEVACLDKDIASLSANINQFTDKISSIFNSTIDPQERSTLIEQASTSYLIFCKQFSKFIYDCGLYLYEEDFLQENS